MAFVAAIVSLVLVSREANGNTILFAIVACWAALVFGLRLLGRRNNVLVVGEEGLFERDCGVTRTVPWADVVEMRREETHRGMAYYREVLLVLTNGETVLLSAVPLDGPMTELILERIESSREQRGELVDVE